MKSKIGGLARRNLALEQTKNNLLEQQLIQLQQQNPQLHNSLQYLNPLLANNHQLHSHFAGGQVQN